MNRRDFLSIAAVASAVKAKPVWGGIGSHAEPIIADSRELLSFRTAIGAGGPESFEIKADLVSGSDKRGLMYGLQEAADQVKRNGSVVPTQGNPALPIRGIRYFIHNDAMEKEWYYSRDYWEAYFSMLAKNRFNRFNLVFAHQTNYMAPPYPFWVELPEFPEIQVPGLSSEQRRQNLEMIASISRCAAEHHVDFTLGIWEHKDWQAPTPTGPRTTAVQGLNDENIGPYSYAALKKVLQSCPDIESVQMRINGESGIPDSQQESFFGNWVFRAIKDAGHPVTFDLRGWGAHPGMADAARRLGISVRLSAKHWGEYMGRPYQPVESSDHPSGYSYGDLLKKSRPIDMYWEVWALGSHRLLMWGDPEFVRRIVPTFLLSNTIGFEIDAPQAQKGFGNGSESFGIFEKNKYLSHDDRKFWRWEFERYWMFYLLWGRLSYDPTTVQDVWMSELGERFGEAASDVFSAYQNGGRVISEIVGTNTIEPVQWVWPEINPGGLIAAYKDTVPYDASFAASPAEAARNVVHQKASAKRMPRETAQILDEIATNIETAVARCSAKLGNNHKIWRGTEPDFQVLAHLARYHARKNEAAYSLSWFYETGSLASVDRAEAELIKASSIWESLVQLTDGLYPAPMIYGPLEFGHWKDKLIYVHHDVAWVQELKRTQQKYGGYDHRYALGEAVPLPTLGAGIWVHNPFIAENSVEPRFTRVHPGSMYAEETGFGWFGAGARSANAQFPAPAAEVREIDARPQQLPINVLLGNSLNVSEGSLFRVRTGDGIFDAVILYSDGSELKRKIAAQDGIVDITFPPRPSREVSAILLRSLAKQPQTPREEFYPKQLPRPRVEHVPPSNAIAGKPLKLQLAVQARADITAVRLYYRPLNASEEVRILQAHETNSSFTIPGEDISGEFDLLYYFEVLNKENAGWFHPDPATATPYYVITVEKGA